MTPSRFSTYATTRRVVGLSVAVALVSPIALAQTPEPAPTTTQLVAESYYLRVTADTLNLRSRPDANSTIVGRVERDAVLAGHGEQYGWHRITPPPNVFSLVHGQYVQRRDEGHGTVSIESGTLRVRVGSPLQGLDPLQAEVQMSLANGAPVEIVGQQGEWLRIRPPDGVYVYVSADYADRVSADVAERLQAATSQPTRLVADAVSPAQPLPSVDREPNLSGPWGRQLSAIEDEIDAEAAKPPLEQSWTEIIARLRPIAEQRTEPTVARLAVAWAAQLEQRAAYQEVARRAEDLAQRADRERARHERELEQIERTRETAASQPAFAAHGLLLRSYAVGERDGRRWFKLQNPLDQQLEAYLELAPKNREKLTPLVGRYVGVHGERRFEEEIGADVVRVTKVVVLDPPAATSQPARPGPDDPVD